MKFLQLLIAGFLFLALAGGTGCVSSRVEHFATFARAGRDYSEVIIELSDQAAEAAIDADSHLLIKDRELFSESERRQIYEQRSAALQELLWTMQGLRRHAVLLQRYFSVLARMAETETPQAMADETAAIVAALQNLHEELTAVQRFGHELGEVVTRAGPLSVAAFKQRALNEELKRNGPLIERELILQERLLELLAGELKADLQVITEARAYTEVARPYIDDSRLPANWPRRRREVFAGYVSLASIDQAVDIAGDLQRLFRELAENRVRAEDWPVLFNDLHSMAGMVKTAARFRE